MIIILFQSLISPWIHGGDPVNAMHINKLLQKFKVSNVIVEVVNSAADFS